MYPLQIWGLNWRLALMQRVGWQIQIWCIACSHRPVWNKTRKLTSELNALNKKRQDVQQEMVDSIIDKIPDEIPNFWSFQALEKKGFTKVWGVLLPLVYGTSFTDLLPLHHAMKSL